MNGKGDKWRGGWTEEFKNNYNKSLYSYLIKFISFIIKYFIKIFTGLISM